MGMTLPIPVNGLAEVYSDCMRGHDHPMGVEDSHFKMAFFEDNSDSFWARVASLLGKAMFLDAVVAYIDPLLHF